MTSKSISEFLKELREYNLSDRENNFKVIKSIHGHKDSITVVAFSPGGELLASADSTGTLLIHSTDQWQLIRRFESLARIRCIAWHPYELSIFVGSSNGDINKVSLATKTWDPTDRQGLRILDGAISDIAISDDGSRAAIVYGNRTAIATLRDDESLWDTVIHLPLPCSDEDPLQHSMCPRNAYFIHENRRPTSVLVSTLHHGINQYEIDGNCGILWTIPKNGLNVGSMALADSNEVLAIDNLNSEVEFWSVKHKKYITTMLYLHAEREEYPVGISFLQGSDWMLAIAGAGYHVGIFMRGEALVVYLSSSRRQIYQAISSTTRSNKVLLAAGGLVAQETALPHIDVWEETTDVESNHELAPTFKHEGQQDDDRMIENKEGASTKPYRVLRVALGAAFVMLLAANYSSLFGNTDFTQDTIVFDASQAFTESKERSENKKENTGNAGSISENTATGTIEVQFTLVFYTATTNKRELQGNDCSSIPLWTGVAIGAGAMLILYLLLHPKRIGPKQDDATASQQPHSPAVSLHSSIYVLLQLFMADCLLPLQPHPGTVFPGAYSANSPEASKTVHSRTKIEGAEKAVA